SGDATNQPPPEDGPPARPLGAPAPGRLSRSRILFHADCHPEEERRSTAFRTFRVLHRLNVILSLRRIRDPSARRHEVRILRLRSQARFAQDDSAPCDRVRDLRFGSYTLSVILSLRRIRDPSARRDEVRI